MRAALGILLLAAGHLLAGVAPNLDKGLALQGYDAVSYMHDQKAVQGSPTWQTRVEGATYRFSSAAHRDAFLKNPKKYEPAYGGWCAYAMSRGELVEVDPTNFKIVKGRLMLFYRSIFIDTLKRWNDKESELLPKADAGWANLNKSPKP